MTWWHHFFIWYWSEYTILVLQWHEFMIRRSQISKIELSYFWNDLWYTPIPAVFLNVKLWIKETTSIQNNCEGKSVFSFCYCCSLTLSSHTTRYNPYSHGGKNAFCHMSVSVQVSLGLLNTLKKTKIYSNCFDCVHIYRVGWVYFYLLTVAISLSTFWFSRLCCDCVTFMTLYALFSGNCVNMVMF